jgi:short-subunit dehydrogenase
MTSFHSILITGASNGIGAALALRYARAGVNLSLTGRNKERLETVARECSARGATCRHRALDVRDTDVLSEWLEDMDRTVPIDLAILNAGIAATRSSPEEGERAYEILAQVETNLGGTLVAAQYLGRAMARRRAGRLALVSSLNGLFPVVEAPTYSATKAGIIAYAQAAREWLEPYGVSVSIVCPGFVRTSIAERYHGARPLEIDADAAARRIATALDQGRGVVAFPRSMVAAIYLGKLMPRWLRRRLLAPYSAELDPVEEPREKV